MSKLIHLALLLTLVSLTNGCGHQIDAVFEFEDETKVAVLPARDPEFGGTIFGSPRGRQIAVRATEILAYELENGTVIEPDSYLERFADEMRKAFNRPLNQILDDEDPYILTDQQIADKIKSDYIVFIDIIEGSWRTRPEGSVNLLRGNAKLKVTVYDNRGLKLKAMGSERVSARYPTKYYERDGITDFDGNEATIENGLIRSCAKQVALLFYPHDEEDSFRITLK